MFKSFSMEVGGTDLFGWMEKNHFDKDGARFIMAVSYTHLDVYKRQRLARTDIR